MSTLDERLAAIGPVWAGGRPVNDATGVAGYVRISQDKTGRAAGVTRQRDSIITLAKAHGIDPDTIVWFQDNDLSATDENVERPDYDRLMTQIEQKRIKTVLLWHTDRLVRRQKDTIPLADLAKRIGGFDVKQQEGPAIDLNSNAGIMLLQIQTAVAEQEGKHKAERQALRYQQQVNDGEFPRNRSFGYAKGGAIIEAEAVYVREIFARYNRGESLRAIAGWLDSEGVVNSRRNPTPFDRSSLRAMLVNPVYIAVRARFIDQRKSKAREIINARGNWEPIIERSVFEIAQVRLDESARTHTQTNALKWLGVNFYICGKCGDTMRTHYNGKKWARGRGYKCAGCHMVRSYADDIDDMVAAEIVDFLDHANISEMIRQDDQGSELVRLAERLADLDAKARLIDAQLDDALDEPTFFAALRRKASQIDQERRTLRAAMDDMHADNALALLVNESDPGSRWDDETDVAVKQRIARAAHAHVVLDPMPSGPGARARIPATVRVTFRRSGENLVTDV